MAAGKLKGIKFQSINVIVLSVEHIPRVLIRWELEKTAQNLNNLKFFVDRGESPTDLRQINPEPIDAKALPEYVDYGTNLLDKNKIYYYRVRAVEFVGTTPVQTFQTEPETWDGNLDLVGVYVVEEHLFEHRYVDGVPCLIFKKMREGPVCPECWDAVLKKVTKSNCKTCKGTGKLGGFYPPVEGWVKFEPDAKSESVADWGKLQQNQADIQFTNYPLLNPDDIIVELKPNKFWKVSRLREAEKNRITMLQFARVDSVYPKDIEYSTLEIPDAKRKELVAILDARDKEREF